MATAKKITQKPTVVAVMTLYADAHGYGDVDVGAFLFVGMVKEELLELDLERPKTDCPILCVTYPFGLEMDVSSFEKDFPLKMGWDSSWLWQKMSTGWPSKLLAEPMTVVQTMAALLMKDRCLYASEALVLEVPG